MRSLVGMTLALTALFFVTALAFVRPWANPDNDPQSLQIIFASNPISGSGVLSAYSRIMNADGSDVHIMDFSTDFACSPDGHYLAFWKDGWHITSANGTNIRPLTMYVKPFSRVLVTDKGTIVAISQPTDHQNVSISQEPDGAPFYPGLPFATALYTLSSDGRRMAFSLFFPPYGIYIANNDGSGLTRVRERNIGPVWSPDNREILSYADDGYLYMSDVERLITVRLTQAAQLGADWSPDGDRVVFVRDFEIVVRDLGTGEERQLTHDLHASLNTWPCFLTARPISLIVP
jgi:Tol biopolymer transport system component